MDYEKEIIKMMNESKNNFEIKLLYDYYRIIITNNKRKGANLR
ncbi:hypothetical protein [uncultured Clostridium sp.]|nr:hypothetical protein [uncultured Clostridium sp.]